MSTVIEQLVTAAMLGEEPPSRIFMATCHYSLKDNPTKAEVREYYRKVVDIARGHGFDGKAMMVPEEPGRFKVVVERKRRRR